MTENYVTSPTNTLNLRKRLRKCNARHTGEILLRAQTILDRLAPGRRAPDRFQSPAPYRADRRRRPRRDGDSSRSKGGKSLLGDFGNYLGYIRMVFVVIFGPLYSGLVSWLHGGFQYYGHSNF